MTDDEAEALRQRATEDGISMQEAARRAVRLYVGIETHRARVFDAAERVMEVHADALYRLGR
ncbi:MAG: CopG family transcriptional regulator [Acidimicrobiales bacterium]